MKTTKSINFEFVDGDISMHVALTQYEGMTGKSYRVSHHNTMREIDYSSRRYEDYGVALHSALELRHQCYQDLNDFLNVDLVKNPPERKDGL